MGQDSDSKWKSRNARSKQNEEGMNFAAEVLPGAEAAVVLYQKGSAVPCREIPFTERMGKVCTMLVSGLNTKNMNIISALTEKSCRIRLLMESAEGNSSEFGETEKMKTRSAVPFLQKGI